MTYIGYAYPINKRWKPVRFKVPKRNLYDVVSKKSHLKKKSYNYDSDENIGYGYSKNVCREGKIIDTHHHNPFYSTSAFKLITNKSTERDIIKKGVRKKKAIIYGSTAFNDQVPEFYKKRPISDVDILSKNHKNLAVSTERRLDRFADMNNYFVSELKCPGGTTFRIHSRAEGGEVIADVSPMKRKPPIVIVNGIKYETIASREREVRRMLKDPDAIYRREKDLKMLGYILRYKRRHQYGYV